MRLRWQVRSLLGTVLHRLGRHEKAIAIDIELRDQVRFATADFERLDFHDDDLRQRLAALSR